MALPMFGLRAQTQLLERDTVTFFRSKDVEDAERHRQNLELHRSDSTYLWFKGSPSQFKNGSDRVGRVVNRNGLLTGKHHFATPTHMQELLEKEGVKVKNDQVVDFSKRFWDPAVELGL